MMKCFWDYAKDLAYAKEEATRSFLQKLYNDAYRKGYARGKEDAFAKAKREKP